MNKLFSLLRESIGQSWKAQIFIISIGILLFPLPVDNLKFILLSIVCLIASLDTLRSKHDYAIYPLFIFAFPVLQFVSITWSNDPSLAIGESFRWLLISTFSYLIFINTLRDKSIGVGISTILTSIFLFYLVFHLVAIQLDTQLNSEWNALMTQNKNYTSSLLVCLFPFLLFYRSNNQFVRFLKIISILLIINLLVHTGARGAMLALAGILLLKLYDYYAYTKWRFIIVLSFMGTVLFGIHFMNTSRSSDDILFVKEYREQLDSRVGLNKLSIAEFTKSPIWGTGAGQWSREIYTNGVSHLSPYNAKNEFLRHRSHNLYFKTITETGIIGFILLFGFLAHILYRTKRKWTIENTFIKAAWVCLMSVLIIVYFYADAISYEFFFSGIIFLGYASLGVLLTKLNQSKKNIPLVSMLLVCSSLLCVVWFGYSKYNWDQYQRAVTSIEKENILKAIDQLDKLYHPFFNASHGISQSIPHLIANQYLLLEDNEQANEYFIKALQQCPNHEPLLLDYAQFLIGTKDNSAEALQYVNRILSIQNNHTESINLKKDLLKAIEER